MSAVPLQESGHEPPGHVDMAVEQVDRNLFRVFFPRVLNVGDVFSGYGIWNI